MMNQPENVKLAYSVKEAAAQSSLSERTIHRLVNNGTIKVTRINGRMVIPHHVLAALVNGTTLVKETA